MRMPATDMAARFTPYVQELLENEYARDNLREGADKLRAAYERSRKRRGRLLLALLTGVAIGGAVALGASEDLRSAVLGSEPATESGSDGSQT
jgi:hypothetical protein